MTTAEAAQRWAEANDKLGAATAALDQANTAHDAAAKEEHEAWEALEQLAGRVPVIAKPLPIAETALNAGYATVGFAPVNYRFDDGFIK